MFHVALENVRQCNYFTEKLLDCFLTRTVPIYWGCPNIADYFDTDGMLIIPHPDDPPSAPPPAPSGITTAADAAAGPPDQEADTLERLTAFTLEILNGLTEDAYSSRLESIDRNFHLACQWTDQRARMQKAISTALQSPGQWPDKETPDEPHNAALTLATDANTGVTNNTQA